MPDSAVQVRHVADVVDDLTSAVICNGANFAVQSNPVAPNDFSNILRHLFSLCAALPIRAYRGELRVAVHRQHYDRYDEECAHQESQRQCCSVAADQ